jgi:hypothetical protein
MSEKTEIKYSPELLDTISKLTGINKSIIIKKDEDEVNLLVNNKDAEEGVAYMLSAPLEYFSFQSENVCLYNYQEFYSLYSFFEDSVIEQDEYDLTIKQDKSKIDFRLTDIEQINQGRKFRKIIFEEPDIEFQMDEKFVTKIKKLCAGDKINATYIDFNANGDGTLTYKLRNETLPNAFEETIDVTDNLQDEFDITIKSESFNKLPIASYTLGLKEEGLIEFKQNREDDISLKLYLAHTE